jgi:adenosylhomocysteine nucleosidase
MDHETLFITATPYEAKMVLRRVFPDMKLRPSDSRLFYLWTSVEKGVACAVTGMGPERASRGLEAVLNSIGTVRAVVGIGVAGGLAKSARSGAVVLPTRVLFQGREETPTEWLRMSLASQIEGTPLRSLLTSRDLICSVVEKAAAHAATGAEAVDMESGAWGNVSRSKGIPWAILRTVLDSAEEALPESFRYLWGPFGEPRWRKVIPRLLLHPSEFRSALTIQKRMSAFVSEPLSGILRRWLEPASAKSEIEAK